MSETRTRSKVITAMSENWSFSNDLWYPGSCSGLPHRSGYPTTTQGSTQTELHTQLMTDVITPDYHFRSSKGDIINNPLESTITLSKCDVCEWSYEFIQEKLGCTPQRWYPYLKQTSIGTRGFDHLPIPDLPYTPDSLSTEIAQAVTQAYANIDTSEIYALATLAEAGKTAKSLYDMTRRLFRIIKALKKLQLKALRKELNFREIRDRYMEIRYSVRPLMYDAIGLQKALTKKLNHLRMTFRGSRVKHSTNADVYSFDFNFQPWATRSILVTRSQKVESVVRAGVLTDVEDTSLISPFGIDKLVESAWELIPFSFIVDWFVNAGEVIGSWTPNFGIRELASWYTVKTTVTNTSFISGDNWSFDNDGTTRGRLINSTSLLGYGRSSTIETKTRTPNPERSILPSFNIRLNEWKLLDLAIITRKLWSRGKFPLATFSFLVPMAASTKESDHVG